MSTLKSTDRFKNTIEMYLNSIALNDDAFASKMENPKKSIDDCITYILNQVQKSGCHGFEDSEIYGMAMHYYDEENIEVGNPMEHTQVIVNHTVELTEEEIKELKQQSKDKVFNEERRRLKVVKTPKKQSQNNTPTLFD